MRVTRFHDRDEFRRRTTPYLLRREAENNYFLGLMSQFDRYPEIVLCAVTADSPGDAERGGGDVVAVATMTPPWHMMLTRAPSADAGAVCAAAADFLAEQDIPVPGIQGESATVEAFARRWLARRSLMVRRDGLGLGIYQLDRVIPPPAPPAGSLRVAAADDCDLLLAWRDAFIADINDPPRDGGREEVERCVRNGSRFLWCDEAGRPVCMVGVAGPTPNGIRISAVYTPPQHRRRGYASAATAAVSQRMLDGGKTFCFLYTDLANPTSNKIYRDIGYKHVCDQVQVFFDPAGPGAGATQ